MSIIPSSLEAKLKAGGSINETKTVNIPELPPKADVIFCFDLTGSMGGILETAKTKAIEIINNLNALGIDIQYGVTSHMDYPEYYNSYGYAAQYGVSPDYPYQLNQSISGNISDIISAINSLTLGYGADYPENYTRVLYESYADESLGWRTGSKRIFVDFGDSVPHDNDLNEDVPGKSGTWSTGGDPGRDTVMFTADDLDLQNVLNEMKNKSIILIRCNTTNDDTIEYWNYWSGITGGSTFITGSDTLVEDVTNAIKNALVTPTVTNLHLETSSGYETWLTSVTPPSYSGSTGVSVNFDITITVPEGTPDGEYCFTIFAVDDSGIFYGEQSVCIEVSSKISMEDAINLLLASIAFEELGLAHIINAEAEKIQYVIGTLEDAPPLATPTTIRDLLRINQSVDKTLRNVIKKEMLLQFKMEDIISHCVSSTFDFPSVNSTVIASVGFINDVEIGFFWSVDRGDRVSQTFSAGSCVNRASLNVEVVNNCLHSGAFVNWELVINGVTVGGFTIENGFTGPISVDFCFPAITGPIYEVDLRVTNQVPAGEGSITLAYASDFAHSLTLTCCNQSTADVASKVAEKKTKRSAPNAASQPEFSLEVNNRKP